MSFYFEVCMQVVVHPRPVQSGDRTCLSGLYKRLIFAALLRARNAHGTEPHTHGISSTSFRLVVTWLTERTYVRRRLQIVRVGYGRPSKGKEGVSQACLGKSTSCILDIHNMVNWQLSKQDSHWPVSHDRIVSSCVNSSRWRDSFIWKLSADYLFY